MWRTVLTATTGAFVLLACGCMSSEPLLDNPVFLRPNPCTTVENPVFLPQGPEAYNALFEMVLDVVDDYFEIMYSNRYDGRIVSFPRISPGYFEFFKPGSPDPENRLLATLQTIRNRCEVHILPDDDGGFRVDVKVYKELEDLAQPLRMTAGAAVFRSDDTLDRQPTVIDAGLLEANWIPLGRDTEFEQLILQRLAKWDRKCREK